MIRLALVLLLVSAAPAPACEPPERVATALRVQGYPVEIVSETGPVARAMRFLRNNGLPRSVTADGLLLVDLPDGLRISFIRRDCLTGMVSMDRPTEEALRNALAARPPGRDA